MKCRVWYSLQCGELHPVVELFNAWLNNVKKCLICCTKMTNKSYINKVNYLLITMIISTRHHSNMSNYGEVRRNYDTTYKTFYWNASRSIYVLCFHPEIFKISALRVNSPFVQVTLPPSSSNEVQSNTKILIFYLKNRCQLRHKISIIWCSKCRFILLLCCYFIVVLWVVV